MKKIILLILIFTLFNGFLSSKDHYIALRLMNNSLNKHGFSFNSYPSINDQQAQMTEEYQMENYLSYSFELGKSFSVGGLTLTLAASVGIFSSEHSGHITASIPHPLVGNSPRSLETDIEDMQNKGTVVNLSVLLKTLDFGWYSNNIGIGVGIQTGSINLLESITVAEALSAASNDFEPFIREVDKQTYKYSIPMVSIRLDNIFRVLKVLDLFLNLRYTVISTITLEHTKGDDLEIDMARFSIYAGLRINF